MEWPLSLGLSEMKSQLHALRERQAISGSSSTCRLTCFCCWSRGCCLWGQPSITGTWCLATYVLRAFGLPDPWVCGKLVAGGR